MEREIEIGAITGPAVLGTLLWLGKGASGLFAQPDNHIHKSHRWINDHTKRQTATAGSPEGLMLMGGVVPGQVDNELISAAGGW